MYNSQSLRACEASGRVERERESQILIQVPTGKDLCLALPPPGLRLGPHLECGPMVPRLKTDPKPIFVDIVVGYHFGSILAPIWAPFFIIFGTPVGPSSA